MPAIKILVVDDEHLFRKGLRALIAAEQDLEVVGEASDGLEALEGVLRLEPDVVLMDIRMPFCDGVQATRAIKQERPEARVLALTIADDDDDLFEAIRNGADGYLLKNIQPEELFALIRGAMRGESPVSPAVAGRLLQEFRHLSRPKHGMSPGWDLTQREREILQLVTDGLSNAQVASRLHVVEGTVKGHMHSILHKLHLKNRVQAAAYALREGIVSPPSRETDPATETPAES
jgi:two-component system nitrate/nitrite response regulator NarL